MFCLSCMFLSVSISLPRAPQRAVPPMKKRIWKVGKVHRSSLLFSACLQHCGVAAPSARVRRVIPLLSDHRTKNTLKSLWLNNIHVTSVRICLKSKNVRLQWHLRLCDLKTGYACCWTDRRGITVEGIETGLDGLWFTRLTCMMAQPFVFSAKLLA